MSTTPTTAITGTMIEAEGSASSLVKGETLREPKHSSTAASLPNRPVSGLIGILKPSGRTSMSLLETLKPYLAQSSLFQVPLDEQLQNSQFKSSRKRRRDTDRFAEGSNGKVMAPKIGQGGTLDPLADGVLVLGIGAGTKRLQQFLHCTKEYKTVGLLGTSTLSYDADDPILHRRGYGHVDADLIRSILPGFSGKFKQLPPLYSAIRIEGKRLFDYAREGKDLPRPIEGRDVEITHLELVDWKEAGQHDFTEPTKECDEAELKIAMRARRLAGLEPAEEGQVAVDGEGEQPTRKGGDEIATTQDNGSGSDSVSTIDEAAKKDGLDADEESGGNKSTTTPKAGPPTFTLQMTVSSGTYVRSVVHDVGIKARSAAHVVRLSRTRQGNWISPEYQLKEEDDRSMLKNAIDWETLVRAGEESLAKVKRSKLGGDVEVAEDGGEEEASDPDALSAFDRLLFDHMEVIGT
ncbi:hypothetical protein CBS101457_004795 [Exobasidium rhododendri]|nr:hypothetical protein CBS101457_004795 [Exobasidium rhododendri]